MIYLQVHWHISFIIESIPSYFYFVHCISQYKASSSKMVILKKISYFSADTFYLSIYFRSVCLSSCRIIRWDDFKSLSLKYNIWISLRLASVSCLFPGEFLKYSWFFLHWLVFYCILNTLNIMLWDAALVWSLQRI